MLIDLLINKTVFPLLFLINGLHREPYQEIFTPWYI